MMTLACSLAVLAPGCGGDRDVPAPARPTPAPDPQVQAPQGDRTTGGLDIEETDYEARWQVKPPEDPSLIEFLDLFAHRPATWTWVAPRSAMRLINYIVPAAEGSEPADFAVIHFTEASGSTITSNIERWKSLFRSNDGGPLKPIITAMDIAGSDATIVELHGEYMGMGAGWHRPDYVFLGVIIPRPGERIYIKLVGPSATIEAHREAWNEVLSSLSIRH